VNLLVFFVAQIRSYTRFFLGDLERVRQQLADSETEKQAMKQRIEQLQRNQQDLEQKVTTMQIAVSVYLYNRGW